MARRHALWIPLLLALSPLSGAGAQERFGDFLRPEIHGYRLDFCRHFASQCGQPAADLFCEQMGFERAGQWEPSGPVSVPTLVFGDGAVCNGPNCSAFNTIRCVAGAPVATPDAQVQTMVVPQGTPIQEVPPTAPSIPAPTLQVAPRSPPSVQIAPRPVAPPADLRAAQPSVVVPIPLPRVRPAGPSPIVPNMVAVAPPPPQFEFNPAFAEIASPPPQRPLFFDLSPTTIESNAEWLGVIATLDSYPEGARVFECLRSDCEFEVSVDISVDPGAEERTRLLFYSVSKVPHASGAIWQVAAQPFPPFANGAESDYSPPGLVFSGRQDGPRRNYLFDFGTLAGASSPDAFYVRAIPVSNVGLGLAVGKPSNTIKIYYGQSPPPPDPVEIYSPQVVEPAPPVRLVSLEFRPYRFIDWPAGCLTWEEYRDAQEKNFFEKIGDVFSDIWNFASDAWQWAKDRVIDIASALTFGIIPDSVLEFALNSALVAAGIPPDIPNLDEMISGGLDKFAGEIAKVAVSQIPSGELAGDLGELVGSEIAAALAQEGEERLRERLQRELEARSREALIRAADELESAARRGGSGALCQSRFIPPYYRVTVENQSDQRIAGAWLNVGDSQGVYLGVRQDFDLWPRQRLSMVLVPEPNIKDVWDNRLVRMEPMATSKNNSNWWNEILFKTPTSIGVSLKGDYMCLGNCYFETRQVLRSAPQLLTERYYGEPLFTFNPVLVNP